MPFERVFVIPLETTMIEINNSRRQLQWRGKQVTGMQESDYLLNHSK